ncbi:chromate transporter [Clostridium sp.]
MKFKELMDLFWVFFRIGAFTFGGGFAMIPLIEKEIVTNKKWIEKEDIINLFAVSQSIPGAIAINTSSLVGYKIGGKKGAIVATIAVIAPAFMIIICIATFFTKIADSNGVKAVFVGINAAVIVMISMASVNMIKAGVNDIVTLVIMLLTVISILFFNISPILMIILGSFVGIIKYIKMKKERSGDVK